MKNLKKIVFFLALALVATTPVSVGAASEGDVIYVPAGQTVDSNFIKAGNAITIEGNVVGDVIAAGNSIEILGTVEGDVIAAANSITIRGTVRGSVRAVGNTVTISGPVEKNVWAAGSNVSIENSARVGWDVYAAGATVKVSGPVGGNLWLAGAGIVLNSSVGKNANLYLERESKVTLLPATVIAGNLTYDALSDEQLEVHQGAQVQGETARQQRMAETNDRFGGAFFLIYVFAMIVGFFSLLIVGIVLVSMVPKVMVQIYDNMTTRPGAMVGWGIVWLLLTPIIVVALFVTVIGIPLALMLLALYGISLFLCQLFAAFTIGLLLFNKMSGDQPYSRSLMWPLIAGLVIYIIVVSIPVIGVIVKIAAIVWSLGGLIAFKRQAIQEYR